MALRPAIANKRQRFFFYVGIHHELKQEIKKLTDLGNDVNETNYEGETALFDAVQSHNESVVRALIAAGADVNKTDNEGETALFYIVQQSNNESVVRAFTDAGVDKNITDEGKSALFYAVQPWWNESEIRALVDAGADVNTTFIIEQFYPLLEKPETKKLLKFLIECKAVKTKTISKDILSVTFCKILCFQPGSSDIDVDSLSAALGLVNEFTTAFEIKKQNAIKKISRMVSEVNHNIRLIDSGKKCRKLIRGLIKLGANPNTVDSDGNTALHYATQLALHGVPQDTVMEICHQLEKRGISFDIQNHNNETPLLFCLSRTVEKVSELNDRTWSGIKTQADVCRFLVEHESNVEAKTKSGESVLHLTIRLLQQGLLKHNELRKDSVVAGKELLRVFLLAFIKQSISVSIQDNKDNTPLHLWATLELPPGHNYSSTLTEGCTFHGVLGEILVLFTEHKAQLNIKNEIGQTPLHLCRTWAAVELLLDAGANPNDVDSSGRSPLLVAAHNNESLKRLGSLYPDISQHPNEFWRTVLQKSLNPWTVEEYGESVLSLIVKSESRDLATALVRVACDQDSDVRTHPSIMFSLLTSVCKDTSSNAHLKKDIAELILISTKCPVNGNDNVDSPLHYCCRNIIEALKGGSSVDEIKTTVHWSMVKLLRSYEADYRNPDASGLTCLDIAEKCPALKELLLEDIDLDRHPVQIQKWKRPVSKMHERYLAKVARYLESLQAKPYWYHKDPLAQGSFGTVFAGINENDGREVAIKRVENVRVQQSKGKREISNLIALAECEQVVRYLNFMQDEHFSYIVLELMEGNLDELLDNAMPKDNTVTLCQDVVKGLQFLHKQNILHRDLKPKNILFKTHPKLCLKIADFGLSRCMDSTGTTSTVYGYNVGTRCWIAPEVLNSTKEHSKSSDVFSCGLVLHYILSVKKHPFAPADCAKKGIIQINRETEYNISKDHTEGWDDSLCPEGAHLIKQKLDSDDSKRPAADKALDHPFFWTQKKKMDFLIAVGNQPEFECPRAKRKPPLTAVETDLESNFGIKIKYVDWNDPGYVHMPAIYTEMTKKRRYDTKSVVELVRFVRNAIAHVSESTRPTPIRKQLLEDFVFLEYFPNLVMEVYKAVTIHGWDHTREEIMYIMK